MGIPANQKNSPAIGMLCGVIVVILLAAFVGLKVINIDVEEKITGEDVSVILVSTNELAIESMIVSNIRLLKNQFESELNPIYRISRYSRQLPKCEQCSNLEYLLIWQKLLSSYQGFDKDHIYIPLPSDIKGASYVTKSNEAKIKRELSELETMYEKMFNIPVPWWWVCSVEERIRRLEVAIKTGKRYPYYPAVEDRTYYEMGMVMAAYEMWFRRSLPECTRLCSEEERLRHAKQALNAGLPYLSEKEDVELKNKLKNEYKRRFGISISDYWLSVARIHFAVEHYNAAGVKHISVTRTAFGSAIAEYFFNNATRISLELSMKDWLDFINALEKFDVINKWEKAESSTDGYMNKLTVFTLNSDRDDTGKYCIGNVETRRIVKFGPSLCPNVKKVIGDMQARIEKKGKKISTN
jgi:hypothetical protein